MHLIRTELDKFNFTMHQSGGMTNEKKLLLSLIFFLLLLNNLIIKCEAAVTFVDKYCSVNSNDYAVQDNIKSLFQNLSGVASKKNFYNSSVVNNSGKIYGLFQCREDLNLQVCAECIQDAMLTLAGRCANSTEAVAWYYECMLRYSSRSVFPLDSKTPFISVEGRILPYSSNPVQFDKLLWNTIELVIEKATDSSRSLRNFAVEEAQSKWYTLAQCIPVISGSECKKCLQIAKTKMLQCCSTLQYASENFLCQILQLT